MSATTVTPREFICPGQAYAISHAVHLARMMSGFAACRDCRCNDRNIAGESVLDGSGLTPQREDRPRSPGRSRGLFTTEGVRGVFQNELSLSHVETIATALANILWEDAETLGSGVPAQGFPVVIGYDDRPWSMPVAVAAGAALRRAGCETIDVGFVSGPAFRFAVSHLDAAAGLLATGAGGAAALAGLDVVGRAGRPLSAGGSLERLRTAPAGRLTRRGRGRREFDVNIPYEANLKRHFQDAAATSVVIGTSSPILHRRLSRMSRDIAATVTVALLPRDAHDGSHPSERVVAHIMKAVRESGSNLGVWIDEDGSIARVLDHHRGLHSVEDVAAVLIQAALNDRPGGTVAVDWTLADKLGEGVLRGREVARSGGTAEAMAITLADHAAAIGVDSTGRLWLPGPPVACDALVMLARVLKTFGNCGTC